LCIGGKKGIVVVNAFPYLMGFRAQIQTYTNFPCKIAMALNLIYKKISLSFCKKNPTYLRLTRELHLLRRPEDTSMHICMYTLPAQLMPHPAKSYLSNFLGPWTISLDPTFGKFYLIRFGFILGESVSLVKVFRLEWIVLVFRVCEHRR